MADYGIGITKTGVDVFSSVIDQQYFNSSTFLFKTIATGSYSFTTTAGGVGTISTASVSHGLGYRPMMMGFWSTDNTNWHPCGYRFLATFVLPGGGGFSGNGVIVETYSDTTNVITSVYSASGAATTVYIRYIIYIDSLG